jgi:hypothetical protein
MTFSTLESYSIYMTAFIMSAICAALYSILVTHKVRYVFFILAATIPAVLACIRGVDVGTDYVHYVAHFHEVGSKAENLFDVDWRSGLSSRFEFGYYLLVYVLSRLTDNILLISFGVYFLSAVAILTGVTLLFRGKYVFAAYLFYLCAYWLLGFNVLRQAMAMSLVFLSISFVINRRLLAFLVVVALAVSIHRTALLVLPIYFLYSDKKGRVYLYDFALVIGGAFGLFFFETIASRLAASIYLTNRGDEVGVSFVIALQAIIMILPSLLLCLKYAKLPLMRFYCKILLIIIAMNFISPMAIVLSRLVFYFEIFMVPISLAVFSVMAAHKNSVRHLYFAYLVLYFVVYKFIYVYSGSGGVLPYAIIIE